MITYACGMWLFGQNCFFMYTYAYEDCICTCNWLSVYVCACACACMRVCKHMHVCFMNVWNYVWHWVHQHVLVVLNNTLKQWQSGHACDTYLDKVTLYVTCISTWWPCMWHLPWHCGPVYNTYLDKVALFVTLTLTKWPCLWQAAR